MTPSQKRRLVALGMTVLTNGVGPSRKARIAKGLEARIDEVDGAPSTDARERAALLTAPPVAQAHRAPASLKRLLVRLVGAPTVVAMWNASPPHLRRSQPLRPPYRVLIAAARLSADPKNAADQAIVTKWIQEKGTSAMPTFEAELRGLPVDFPTREQAFTDAVAAELAKLKFDRATHPGLHAVVVGKLLLEGIADETHRGFVASIRRSYNAALGETIGKDRKTRIRNYETYESIAGDLAVVRGRDPIRYQEIASVADYVVASADDWPTDDDTTRRTQVDIGLTRYVEGTADTGFATLSLPPIVSEDASQQEIERPNVEAVAMVAAAAEIEQTGAFDVVDRMLELFLNGMLPVQDDSGGRALDRYYWDSEDRLDAAARSQLYARVVGYAGGGGASPDVQPNTRFHDLLMRLVSSLVRYESDMQVAQVVAFGRQDTIGAAEYVRKSAHDFLANSSLYGWGFTIFAARRLKRHVDQVFEVLEQESLQRAYGVTGPWQLVERVSALELGATPNVVAHRTMAKASKDILDILARYANALATSGASGRFLPSVGELAKGTKDPGTIMSIDDYTQLVTAAHNILAVNGVGEEDVYRMAQPTRSAVNPSIPTVGAVSGNGDGSHAGLDQIRQLVAQGQAPSLEQLQRLLPVGGIG